MFDRARGGARQFAKGFTAGQKAVTIAAVAAVAIGSVVVMSITGKPTYSTLFTNLQPQDAASITSKLASQKIPYQLTDGGATVMVPAGDVNQERISLAQAGLPASSTPGLSILDKEGLTTSNMTQQADYLRAIQGELEQTIDSISGVASSQVNVALPANQNFALNNNTPTGASVMVTMQQGQTLSDGEVQAIVHLVGSSVPNLATKNVTVADSNGNLLAGPGVAEGTGGSSQANTFDSSIQQKVEAYLAGVVGPNNADVQVNANLDYSQVSTTTNSIMVGSNGKPVSFCTQTSQNNQSYTGTGTPPGGAAGTVTATSGTGSGTYTNNQNSQTCETSEQTQTVQQAPGTLKSEEVAVLLNSKAVPPGTDLNALKAGVAAAAGINTSRGDQLAFSTMPFNSAGAKQAAAAAKAAAAAAKKKALYSLVKTGVVVLVIGLVLFLLWRSARRARMAPSRTLGQADLDALRAARPMEMATAKLPVTPVAEVAASAEAADVNRFIDSQPEDVANMLRTWLQLPAGR